MIYKCKNCEGNLVYSVEEDKMKCEFCGSLYSIEEVSEQKKVYNINAMPSETGEQKIVHNAFFSDNVNNEIGDYNTLVERQNEEKMVAEARANNSMQMQICRCTSCGSELMVNGVEASTFCAYCGQATVVLDRVEDCLKPDYIIPFRIQQVDAERIIRSTLEDGKFVPNEIKNFEIEKLRGIYIPFWLMDFYYHDAQYLKYTKKVGKSTVTRYVYVKGDCDFKNVTVDASKNLNNDSSQRLEPYDMRQLKEFNPSYLAGFYSDRFDDKAENLEYLAVKRMKALFDEQIKLDSGHPSATLVSSTATHTMRGTKYALLPAWFLSFKYDGKPFTIMVNGQTGKMVGAVPYVKSKAYALFAALSVLLTTVLIPVLAIIFAILFDPDDISKLFICYVVGIPIIAGVIWVAAKKKLDSIKASIKLTNSKNNNRYMKERQD